MRLFFGRQLLDKVGEGAGGGGAPAGDKPDAGKEVEALKSQNADLIKRLEALEGKGKPDPKEELDLKEKAKKEQEERDKQSANSKDIESALKFSLKSEEFLKTNASLLPKDVADIFKMAEKETYDSAVQKASAIKSGIIQSFFAVQDNLDLLTSGPKSALEEYLKLTKNGKQDRAQYIYETVFEPAFEMLKRVKKAELINRTGINPGSDSEKAYRDKLMNGSKKHYLGEKLKNEP